MKKSEFSLFLNCKIDLPNIRELESFAESVDGVNKINLVSNMSLRHDSIFFPPSSTYSAVYQKYVIAA